MVCDFYVYVYLEIKHSFGTAYYELPGKRGYFSELNDGYYDSDYEEEPQKKAEYQRLYNEIIKLELEPQPPMVIYEKDAFISHHFEDKYRPLLEIQLQKNLLKHEKYEEDSNYKSDDENDEGVTFRRFKDEGISPYSFDQIHKITRKEKRIRPSYSYFSNNEEDNEVAEEKEEDDDEKNRPLGPSIK